MALLKAFDQANVTRPRSIPRSTITDSVAVPVFQLDHELIRAISELVTRCNLSLTDTIRLWRGQTLSDPAPTKALSSEHFAWLVHDYELVENLTRTVNEGVKHAFHVDGTPANTPVPNHKSAIKYHNALIRSIRDGQNTGSYLVVSGNTASRWNLHYSPFGCVQKGDTDPSIEVRVIHDLSCPSGSSTNSRSDQDNIPVVTYDLVDNIAKRIIELRQKMPDSTIKLMKGDVKSAYKNLHVHETVSAYFTGSIPEQDAVVLDLALPFGWTGSAAHYGVFGKAISHLVRRESPNTLNPADPDNATFFCFDWVDDHVLVEHDIGNRLEACESALRLAMTAVLGPRAINIQKFTEWSTNLIALGLEWDSETMSVSMTEKKITKAIGRVQDMLAKPKTTRTCLSKLLGSLRHICTCIRAAKPFFQRLAAFYKRSSRSRPVTIDPGSRLDLIWFAHILQHGRLRGVPLQFFGALPDPMVHLYMDASDIGLCVLNPARKEFLRIQFDTTERNLIQNQTFSINVREQFSALLAVLCWGEQWCTANQHTLVHARFWIDNAAAVAWCNNLVSGNPYSQEMNRIFGAVEAEWCVRVSAEHLAGSTNFLADLGSRAWSPDTVGDWNELTTSWMQVVVPANARKAYDGSWSNFSSGPWPIHLDASMHRPGKVGSALTAGSDALHGY